MPDLLDISSALFNSGLESDAVITNGASSYSGKVIYRNQYQRSPIMDINFQGSNPVAICKFDMVSDWSTITTNTATIKIDGRNSDNAFKIREVKPADPNYTILELSYD